MVQTSQIGLWLVASLDSTVSIWKPKFLWASVIQESFILHVWLELDLEGGRTLGRWRGESFLMGGIRGMATFGNCVGFLCWLSCSFHSLLRPTWSVNLPWITKRLLAFLWEKEWPQARKQVYGVSLLFRLHIDFFMGREVGEATGYGNNIKNDVIITTISAYLVSHINVDLIKFVRNTVHFYAGEI